jgi:purine-binding chemotaxis protein CheW
MSASEHETILLERARQLAQPLEKSGESAGVEIVAFGMGGESYGIETAQLRAVYAAREITPLPCAPPWVSGILNVRGRILTVVSLRHMLGLPGANAETHSVLILRGESSDGSGDMALLVDAIEGVRVLVEKEIEPPHALGGARYVRGVTSERLALLDAALILTDPDLIVQDESKSPPRATEYVNASVAFGVKGCAVVQRIGQRAWVAGHGVFGSAVGCPAL